MKQFFTLALIAGACIAQALSGALVMKRLIVVAMLAGLMISAAHGQTIDQQRAAVTQQQAAVALKSSQEYLRAAGWQFQAMTPDGSTWTHSDYVGTVTLAKDGWLVLANAQKVRPERVALYLKGLEEAAAAPAPKAPETETSYRPQTVPAPAPEPEPTSYRPRPQTFDAMSIGDWFQGARRGDFSRDYVALAGRVLQEMDGVVRVECSLYAGRMCVRDCPFNAEEAGICSRIEFTVRLNSERLVQEGDMIRVLGNYSGMQTYVTVLGATRKLPSFRESTDAHLVD
jgi:hypothetical protein